MINETKLLVEESYTKKNGYDHDAKVIYGDTDSVMVNFGYVELAKVMELSREAAKYVTNHFKKPINLEFEKVYFPYLLIGKKRYAGLYWTNPIKHDKVDIKGIDIVRRDRCGLVQSVMKRCLDEILINRNVEEAVGIVNQALRDLLRGTVDLTLLTFSGGWGKSNYTVVPPHVAVAKKTMKRDRNVTIKVGDRISYVITAGVKGSKVSDKAEDPEYVRANNLPIDVEYYLSQLKRPLNDIFSPILGGDEKAASRLFSGDHMNHIVKPVPTLPPAFAGFVVTRRCKICKNPLSYNACNKCQ
jgi:DNA polymerase delta subunit 1